MGVVHIKKFFLDRALLLIKNNNPGMSEIDIAKIRYGLEGIYLLITKLIIISLITIYFGIFIEFLIFTIFYNFIRIFAFGVHANKSFICLFISSLIFVSLPAIAPIIEINYFIKYILSALGLICVIWYAPADTKKRPLINFKKRRRLKTMSIFISMLYICIIIFTKDLFISNIVLFALLTEVILILPITYKVFKTPYNNYKTYCNITTN